MWLKEVMQNLKEYLISTITVFPRTDALDQYFYLSKNICPFITGRTGGIRLACRHGRLKSGIYQA